MITLILRCHGAYEHWLPETLGAWRAQAGHLSRCIAVLDHCTPAARVLCEGYGFEVMEGHWYSPTPGTNAAAQMVTTPWLIMWDTDNVPLPDFARVAAEAVSVATAATGIVVPKVISDGRCLNLGLFEHPESADPRHGWCVDTASIWRTEAYLAVGGLPDPSEGLDDWALAARIYAAGWGLKLLPELEIRQREHPERRTHTGGAQSNLWLHRSVGVVCLFAGRQHLIEPWVAALREMEMPRHLGMTLVFPADRPDFKMAVLARVLGLQESGHLSLSRLTIITPEPGKLSLDGVHSHPERRFYDIHRRVAGLYAQALAATPEDLVLTWEDDVIPHGHFLRALSDELIPGTRTAAVAAVYPQRGNKARAVASTVMGDWLGMPEIATMPRRVIVIGAIAGGFTLWSRVALQEHPILAPDRAPNGHRLGWDGAVCRRLTADGWKLKLHGALHCEHLTD